MDLNHAFYFVNVVEKQGFSAAARALGIPKSRISRHVRQLEESLDTRLLQRNSRHLSLTEAGKAYLQHARAALDCMATAEAAVRRGHDIERGHDHAEQVHVRTHSELLNGRDGDEREVVSRQPTVVVLLAHVLHA